METFQWEWTVESSSDTKRCWFVFSVYLSSQLWIHTLFLPFIYQIDTKHSFLATLLTFKCSDMVTHVSLSALGWTHIPALNNYFSWSLHTAALQWENKKPKNKIWNQPCAVTCANKIERNVQHLPRDVVIKRWLAWNILKLQYKRSFVF